MSNVKLTSKKVSKENKVSKRKNKLITLLTSVGVATGVGIGTSVGIGVGYAIFHNKSTPIPLVKFEQIELTGGIVDFVKSDQENGFYDAEFTGTINLMPGTFTFTIIGYDKYYNLDNGSYKYENYQGESLSFQITNKVSGKEAYSYVSSPEFAINEILADFYRFKSTIEVMLQRNDLPDDQRASLLQTIEQVNVMLSGKQLITDGFRQQICTIKNFDDFCGLFHEAWVKNHPY